MFVHYLTYYLIFVVVVSLLVGIATLKVKTSSLKIFLLVMLAIVIVPAPVGYLYITNFTKTAEVVVPNLKGLRLETAKSLLQDLGLNSKSGASINDDNYPEGTIVSSQPEGGRIVKKGRTVMLVSSSGKRKIIVPNLLGRRISEAETVVITEGFLLGPVEFEPTRDAEPGVIIAQEPMPEEEVEVGTPLALVVATDEAWKKENEAEKPKEKEGRPWFW